MPKIKAVFLSTTAIAFAVMVWGTSARAAEVTKVNAGEGHVYIDQGKDDGFVFGAEVCFYGPEEKKIACGTVRQSQLTHAMVSVDKKAAKLIKKGTIAELQKEKPD